MATGAFHNLRDILEHVREHPEMWVRDKNLLQLQTIVLGYGFALSVHGIDEFGTDFCGQFGDYLERRFGWSLCMGWASAIQSHSRAKDRGWKRFFELVEDFAEDPAASKRLRKAK